MQKGYKYDLFVKGANGVGFAYVEHQKSTRTKALFLSVASGKQPFSFENYHVDGRVGSRVFTNRLPRLKRESQNASALAYEKRFGIRVQVVEYPIVIQRNG